ncbi:MAG TPA: glycosyltransferase family 2 protein [Puia sp.]|nr:glycosyltransferase family 2 protein [Puia sp.]
MFCQNLVFDANRAETQINFLTSHHYSDFVTLSIIIVNYNVKYFLEQCLCSVRKAIEKMEAEIIVVDNHSTDGSMEYLESKFPGVRFIANKENQGFGKANNKASLFAKGKHILFLNPDTIVAEDSFEKCISFMESSDNTGAIGVKMVDGKGIYLKESKRGFPSAWAAFCKLSGLTSLFPHSGIFSKYYLGNLSEKENQEADVISGAYFFVRKEILDKTGGFDEQFFMYAEDIDLSYRIQRAGYTNYYFAETTIIHFKGESTKKDFRYVKLFYKAMKQFVKKHSGRSALYSIVVEVAIWLRAAIAMMGNLFAVKPLHNKQERYFLLGDAVTLERLRKELLKAKKEISDDPQNRDEIIFCEGKGFCFKQIIDSIEKKSSTANFKIHASNSLSIVGSNSKNKSGEIIAL